MDHKNAKGAELVLDAITQRDRNTIVLKICFLLPVESCQS